MKNLAFIFARGGSKGLPKKNIMPLLGKPLLQYSIEVARNSPSIHDVFVSTDNLEIAGIARQGGATVIDRPKELAADNSAEWLAWRHAIDFVRRHHGNFDRFVSLPTTSPLRSVDDVESALLQLDEKKADFCISITPANRSPFFNMVKVDNDGFLSLVNTSSEIINRRQDAPKVWDITTVVYVTRPDFIIEHDGVFSGKVTAIEVPKQRAVDIDDMYDFKLAELILKEDL